MKRGNGEGAIRQRTSGLWEARYFGPDGQRRSVYAKTQREALEGLRKAQGDTAAGLRPVPATLTVGAWLEEWLAGTVRPNLRPRTVESYELMTRRYIVPAIGRVPLAKLTPQHVARMLADLARTSLSPTSQRYVYAVLRIALGRAVKLGRAHRNVATQVDPPRKSTPEMRALTGAEVARLLASIAGRRLEPLVITAVGTGLRQGELLALRWPDIDLERGTVTVLHTLQRGTRTLAEPKTARARRTIDLPGFMRIALREHRRAQLEARMAAGPDWADGDAYVFTTALGRPMDAFTLSRDFRAELRRAGLPPVRWHDLRHTTATLLLEGGEELGIVSRILGHADFSTTADVYAHLTRSMLGRAADRLDSTIAKAVSETA